MWGHNKLTSKMNFYLHCTSECFNRVVYIVAFTLCSDSDGTEQHIGIIGKPLSNFDTTSLTELEKEEDEEEDGDNDCVNLNTSARSYRTR